MSAPFTAVAPRPDGSQSPVRQLFLITLGAVAIFFLLRFLPTGTNLNHMDFRLQGKNAIEFCDPANPQFIPVVAARSPVTLNLVAVQQVVAGQETRLRLELRTTNGKAIAPEDVLVAHTKKLHLLIVDPSLQDYQHVHPVPGAQRGEWSFAFTPRFGGNYRVFADFTPAATGRGLYASADLIVQGAAAKENPVTLTPSVEQDGFRYSVVPAQPIRAGQPADLRFEIVRPDGGNVMMAPIMGAFAHLVAFDETRSGFAHLHPMEIDLLQAPHPARPVLNFKVTIPQAGRYVIWSQVDIDGRERFAPFWLEVAE